MNWIALDQSVPRISGQKFNYRDVSNSKPLYSLVVNQAQVDNATGVVSNWFCANYLWQLLHDLPLPPMELQQLSKCLFALTQDSENLIETALCELNDAYFINDFQLAPAVKALRSRDVAIPISFFLHTPWPKNQYQDIQATQALTFLATNLLCADQINFQTESDLAHFVTFISKHLQVKVVIGDIITVHLESQVTQLLVNPVSVDSKNLAQLPHQAPSDLSNDDLLFVHIARSDPAKNTIGAISAFIELLRNYQLNPRRMFLDLYIVPSRQDFLEYQDLLSEIQTQVADLNSSFDGEYQNPIRLHIDNDYAKALGALRRFDFLLAPSWADGMNLVVKEAAVLNARNGVIVATPKVGAMATLGPSCVIANSPHPACLVEAIELAMSLSMEQRQRMSREINSQVKFHNLNSWALNILQPISELAAAKSASFVRL